MSCNRVRRRSFNKKGRVTDILSTCAVHCALHASVDFPGKFACMVNVVIADVAQRAGYIVDQS